MATTPQRTFNLRLTDDEMARIDTKAESLGLSRAGLVRRLFERAGLLESADGNEPNKASYRRKVEPKFKKGTKK